MNDDGLPLAEETRPVDVERGPPPDYPLGADRIFHTEHLAALMMGGILVHSVLTVEQAATAAVELAVAITNEVHGYCLRDDKVVKKHG